MDLQLNGKVALVTGAGSGIGAAIAELLAREGCIVYIADLDLENARKVEAQLRQAGSQAHSIWIDVRDPETVDPVVRQVVDERGRIDILVNDAGVLKSGTVGNSSLEDWAVLQQTNLSGVFYCSRAAMPFMIERGYGKIVNLASVAAMKGGGALGNALYGATKAGVVALTQGLARELAPKGINVNAIAPAVVVTPMTRDLLTPEMEGRVLKRIPMGRFASVTDVAHLTAFLASDMASFITGVTIPVDGGFLTT